MTSIRQIACLGAALLLSAVAAADAGSSKTKLDIKSQPIRAALEEFAAQTGLQVVLRDEDAPADGVMSPRVVGELSAQEALDRLLSQSGLRSEFVNERTVRISSATSSSSTAVEKAAPGSENAIRLARAADELQAAGNPGDGQAGRAVAENGDGTITGRVTEAVAAGILSGALVRILETGATTHTDNLGHFRFSGIPPGEYTLSISYLGYADKLWRTSPDTGDGSAAQYVLEKSSWDLAEVTVFGTRSARAKALNLQRTADNSTSVISADLLGTFTDATISEALQRAPGIAFQFRGPLGDGTNATIRGLSPEMNNVRLNGLNLPSSRPGERIIDLNSLLADSVEKITINETLLPSHDSAGTGGLIEIVTKSPLSRPHRYANLSLERGRKGEGFADDVSASGTVSGSFGRERDFGLSASMQYLRRTGRTYGYGSSLQLGQYLPLDPFGGTSLDGRSLFDPRLEFPFEPGVADAYVSDVSARFSDLELVNKALTVSGEWQIAPSTRMQLDVQRSMEEQAEFTQQTSLGFDMSYTPLPVAALDGEVRQALGWNGMSSASANFNSEDGQRTITDTLSLLGSSELGRWRHSWLLGYAEGRSENPRSSQASFMDFTFAPVDPGFISAAAEDSREQRIISVFGRRQGRGFPVPMLTDAGWAHFSDPALYSFAQAAIGSSEGANERYTADFSTQWNLGGRHLKYVELGTRYETTKFTQSILSNVNYGWPEPDFLPPGATALGVTFGRAGLGDIGRADVGFPVISRAVASEFIASLEGFATRDPALVSRFADVVDPLVSGQSLREGTLGTYLESRIDLGKLSFVGGVRLNGANVRSSALTSPTVIREDGTPDLGFSARFRRLQNYDATVSDLLPRFQLNYRQTDNLIFRGGYYLSVARPSVQDLSQEAGLFLILDRTRVFNPDNRPELYISQGNPGLRPAVGNNFDLTAEYYTDQVGLIKISTFYKQVKDLLTFNNTGGFSALDGVVLPDDPYFTDLPEDILIIGEQPVNTDDEGRNWGVVLALERQLTFLPGFWSGFGVYANYAYSRERTPQVFTWYSKPVFGDGGQLVGTEVVDLDVGPARQDVRSGTFALTYNRGPLDGSLTYSWQEMQNAGFAEYGLENHFNGAGMLDARLQYRLNRLGGDFRIYVEGSDLLKGPRDADNLNYQSGAGNEYVSGATFYGGRTLRVGVSASF